MKDKIPQFLLVALILAISFVVTAQGDNYLFLDKALYNWQFSDALPFDLGQELQWDAGNGFSEISEDVVHIGYFIDFPNKRFAYVYEDRGNCLMLFMRPEWGEDNQPHVERAYWIGCPEYLGDGND